MFGCKEMPHRSDDAKNIDDSCKTWEITLECKYDHNDRICIFVFAHYDRYFHTSV